MKKSPWLQFLATPITAMLLLATTAAVSAPCPGGADNDDTVNLNLAKFSLEWKEKKPVCIDFEAGATTRTFEVRIVGPYTAENAPIKIREKMSGDDQPTIRGESTAGSRTFTVTVNEASKPPGNSQDYAFLVDVPNLGNLDPMVRIIRQGGTEELQYNDLIQALDELDIDPDSVPALLEKFRGETQTSE